ncbi:MAG: YbjN domain-containing protein [Beijerinckiaceae bacterium]
MRILSILLGASVLIAATQLNFAQADTQNHIITKITPAEMADILRDLGRPVEVAQGEKQKYLKTSISGYKVEIYFSDCKVDGCEGLQFSTGFDKAPKYTIEFANKWNNEHRYARAVVDPSDGTFYFDHDFLVKGVTPELIKANLLLYGELLDDLYDATK